MRIDPLYQFRNVSLRDQAASWRAAARGHEVMGRTAEALKCWNTARLILGQPPRVAK